MADLFHIVVDRDFSGSQNRAAVSEIGQAILKARLEHEMRFWDALDPRIREIMRDVPDLFNLDPFLYFWNTRKDLREDMKLWALKALANETMLAVMAKAHPGHPVLEGTIYEKKDQT